MPNQPAKNALIIPTNIKGTKPLIKAASHVNCALTFNHTVPNDKVINIPIIFAIVACGIVNDVFSKYKPIIYVVGMKPIRKPPVGPKIMPNPEVRWAYTGMPTAPIAMYNIVAKVP